MLLQVTELKKYYPIKRGLFYRTVGWVQAVDGVSFSIGQGKTLGLVGESGCGKTTLAKAVLRLVEPDGGSINFAGRELIGLAAGSMRRLRKDLQIIFQDPFNSLDPRFTVAKIIQEGVLSFNGKNTRQEMLELSARVLAQVGLDPDSLSRYPHEFSGGQRQRISIARALILDPKLLILDEPVSSLDVSTQGQIIDLLVELQKTMGFSYLFISHDLNVVRKISHYIGVMYLGKIVEMGEVDKLYNQPSHPYTEALLSAVPVLDVERKRKRIILKGDIPSPVDPPSGCRFHTRCPYAQEVCKVVEPQLLPKNDRLLACHFPL